MRVAVIATVVALVLGAIGFTVWARSPLGPALGALEALEAGGGVEVVAVEAGWLFLPDDPLAGAGLVFYPGGRVDPRSYAPLAHAIAAEGYTVALASMPLNLAVFDPDRALDLMAESPGVTRWAVGGHSLGGAMAAAFASSGDPRLVGLVLLAAYPAESTDISERDIEVLSVIGDADRVVDRETWEAAAERLPADTVTITIEGGNHAQFGDYGDQPGDGVAGLSAEDQQAKTVGAIAELLSGL
jgi:dienelactone hydrolase